MFIYYIVVLMMFFMDVTEKLFMRYQFEIVETA